MFCLSYFALNKHIINIVTCFSRLHSVSIFTGDSVFPVYWFGKGEFGKFTNKILVIGGPARGPPPTPSSPLSILSCALDLISQATIKNVLLNRCALILKNLRDN